MPDQPPPLTEAAGLLQSGLIFPRRVGLRRGDASGDEAEILLGFKRGGFSAYFGDAPLLHFDLDGRWQRAFIAGTHYLKGLDTRTRAVDRVRVGESLILQRRTLATAETTDLDDAIAGRLRSLRADLLAGHFRLLPPPAPSRSITREELAALLGRITGWDAAAWAEHRLSYHRAYGDDFAPFLPPDCPNPVILRVDQTVSAPDLIDRARVVRSLLAQRLNQCRDVFLTGPGWLDRPEDEVVGLLGAIHQVFPIDPDRQRPRALDAADAPRLETIHGWVDDLPGQIPSTAALTRFRAAHLGRITLRIDGGAPPDHEAFRALIAATQAAGIGVGLACFVGLAGASSLVALVGSLPLVAGDLVSLIAPDGVEADLTPLKAELAATLPPGPRVVIYNPAKQWV